MGSTSIPANSGFVFRCPEPGVLDFTALIPAGEVPPRIDYPGQTGINLSYNAIQILRSSAQRTLLLLDPPIEQMLFDHNAELIASYAKYQKNLSLEQNLPELQGISKKEYERNVRNAHQQLVNKLPTQQAIDINALRGNLDVKIYAIAFNILQESLLHYNCQYSPWHPKKSIKELIGEIQTFGPHLVIGQLGRKYYTSPPFQLATPLEGRSVFGWKPGTPKFFIDIKNGVPEIHAIILIGAEIQDNKEYVYYLDPDDPSISNDITTQKVYKISYNNLKNSIFSFFSGFPFKPYDEDASTKSINFYAVHM